MADGPHRRRVEHMRTRLRERVRVQARVLEVAFVDRRLARVGYETWVRRRLERAAGRADAVEDLSRSDCDFLVSVKERVLVLGASTHLFVELDFAVKVLLGDPGKVLGLLGVVCLHLGYRRVQHSFAPRRDFLVWLAGGVPVVSARRKRREGRRTCGPSVASVYRDSAFRWVSTIGCKSVNH